MVFTFTPFLIKVLNRRVLQNERFKVYTREFTIKINPEDAHNYRSVLDWYINVFEEVLEMTTGDCRANFKVGIKISLPLEEKSQPIGVPFQRCGQLNGLMLANTLESVIQSNDKWESDVLIVTTTILHENYGLGAPSRGIFTFVVCCQ